jgi:hypothetical protein
MKFEVGEMQLNDTWATSFTVNLTQAGQIEMFGPSSPSQVCFTDASTETTTCQKFPPWSCPVQQSKVNVGFGAKNLSIDNMTITPDSWNSNLLLIGWNITYDGDQNAQSHVQYSSTINHKIQNIKPSAFTWDTVCNQRLRSLQVDTTGWAPGTYTFTVDATSNFAPSPPQIRKDWEIKAPTGQKFIKLE